ncbi:short-chain dehydrogenase/reductase SDR [Nitrospirillum viridazoti Y2]|uniref:NAD(P)-dependent dehydrogenase (Short-subunit alcohol dehydrogenase family) n=1 Tax=Nitrospirillum amazonense TaxID=28077 RepID=A0A560HKC6_9PROT|nr:SDR family oxidoreductase [Nitrospirillum amazonense]EGY02491.1 short-chain dehydrogenase/reductase SDR [Nitrospirillum amazonense Y2]TWB46952.1 NAD(P)-dependent dehydrogenase (short-subunit alcohol dehydrogenase family) [Nitrospirillum amazonense]
MQLDLVGKRALVTGSSSGIGRMIALHLAAEGVEVIVHGRDAARTLRTAEEIRATGGVSSEVMGDLMDGDAAKAVVDQVLAQGGVDILVNNAGGRYGGWARSGWLGTSDENWIATYKQNVISTVTLIDGLVPVMIQRGWGRVVQIASAVALHQPPNFPDYQAAKAAEINLSRSLSRGMAGTGVTSNAISAGIIHTPGSDAEIAGIAQEAGLGTNWRDHEREIALKIFRQTAGRIGRAEDIAAAVCFLASPRADFISGINLVVDGGM